MVKCRILERTVLNHLSIKPTIRGIIQILEENTKEVSANRFPCQADMDCHADLFRICGRYKANRQNTSKKCNLKQSFLNGVAYL